MIIHIVAPLDKIAWHYVKTLTKPVECGKGTHDGEWRAGRELNAEAPHGLIQVKGLGITKREIKVSNTIYKKGDRVRFTPKHRRYYTTDLMFRGQVGTVLDDSDLPNVQMDGSIMPNGWKNYSILTADQRDLELA